jgi:hypothetical protein
VRLRLQPEGRRRHRVPLVRIVVSGRAEDSFPLFPHLIVNPTFTFWCKSLSANSLSLRGICTKPAIESSRGPGTQTECLKVSSSKVKIS